MSKHRPGINGRPRQGQSGPVPLQLLQSGRCPVMSGKLQTGVPPSLLGYSSHFCYYLAGQVTWNGFLNSSSLVCHRKVCYHRYVSVHFASDVRTAENGSTSTSYSCSGLVNAELTLLYNRCRPASRAKGHRSNLWPPLTWGEIQWRSYFAHLDFNIYANIQNLS